MTQSSTASTQSELPPVATAQVLLASPRGFCAGVRRAVLMVEQALETHGAPVYVRKQIVHNQHVVRELEHRGAVFVDSERDVPRGAVCVFSAHGVAPAVRQEAAARDLTVLDATCPLVSKVHAAAVRAVKRGRTVVLVGQPGHEEVEGIRGQDPDRILVVEHVEDVARLDLPADAPLAYLTQTTLSAEETEEVVQALRRRFPQVVAPDSDTICFAASNRQQGVRAMADRCDLVLVVGGCNSHNSLRLVDVARRLGVAAHLVPEVADLDPAWLDGVRTVGVSAGASAPEVLVQELLAELARRGLHDVEVEVTAVEEVEFSSGLVQQRQPVD